MEERQKEHLRINSFKLMLETKISEDVLTYLFQEGILSRSDRNEISHVMNDPDQKVNLFFERVKTKHNSYHVVVEAFRKTDQTGVVKILEEIIEQPPPPPENTNASISSSPSQPLDRQCICSTNTGPEDQIDNGVPLRPLIVDVVKPESEMAFADDKYELDTTFKGHALIINIMEFDSIKPRYGAQHDLKYMKNLWEQLGYHVVTHDQRGRLTRDEVLELLDDFNKLLKKTLPPSFVIFVGSHGSFNKIAASDNQSINLYEEIIYKFDKINCPEMAEKPKMFFIQACQEIEKDADESRIGHAIVGFSTFPGEVAYRFPGWGSLYVYCLTDVFMKEAYRTNLEQLLEKVQTRMESLCNENGIQNDQFSTTAPYGIRKHLYFNMKPKKK